MDNMERNISGVTEDQITEAKRLREQLVEYDAYLQEMRQSAKKNVETLDVIQRYTDHSSAGIQNLTLEGAGGIQKVAEESLSSIVRLSEEYSQTMQNYSRETLDKMNAQAAAGIENITALSAAEKDSMAQCSRESSENLTLLAQQGREDIRNLAAKSQADMDAYVQQAQEIIRQLSADAEAKLGAMAASGLEQLLAAAENDKEVIRTLSEACLARMEAMDGKVQETAGVVNEMRELIEDHVREMEDRISVVSDDNHKECVKVYRNVQAVVQEECAKTSAGAAAAVKGLKPLAVVSLLVGVANAALLILMLLGFTL